MHERGYAQTPQCRSAAMQGAAMQGAAMQGAAMQGAAMQSPDKGSTDTLWRRATDHTRLPSWIGRKHQFHS
jgi:hypothetical protein